MPESGPPGPGRPAFKLSQRVSGVIKDNIVCGYAAGESAIGIAGRLGMTDYAVRQVLMAKGVSLREYALTAEEIARAIELYKSGLSIKAVAQELSRAESSVQKFLVQRGVALRPSTRRWKLTALQIDAAVAAYESGQSLVAISEGLPVGAEAVRRALRNRGVMMRPGGSSGGVSKQKQMFLGSSGRLHI